MLLLYCWRQCCCRNCHWHDIDIRCNNSQLHFQLPAFAWYGSLRQVVAYRFTVALAVACLCGHCSHSTIHTQTFERSSSVGAVAGGLHLIERIGHELKRIAHFVGLLLMQWCRLCIPLLAAGGDDGWWMVGGGWWMVLVNGSVA